MENPNLHPLSVVALHQQQDDQPSVVTLQDELGRNLKITIGQCEWLAIHLVIAKQVVGRPLTHDLMLAIADQLEAQPDRVEIDDFSNETYYARLILTTKDGEVTLDCRPSDGIAIALRANIPILASDSVMTGETAEE